jgi:hypothetical protein
LECATGKRLVALHGYARLSVIVDGSFVDSDDDDLGHGGAGLVLVRADDGEILATRACGFRASSSSDAEFHAVIRAGRWVPGVAIYTDARDLPTKMVRVNPDLAVHYLDPNRRASAYALAHRLSVEGRCRDAPHTLSSAGIEFAAARATLTKTQRKVQSLRRSVALLLERAHADPSFDGDFTAIAESFGWTSGKRWRENPAIRIAADRWAREKSPAAVQAAVQEVAPGITRREDHLAHAASSHAAEDKSPDAVLLPQHGPCD